MGTCSRAELINAMKNGLFSIATDDSNKSEKYYPLVVTFFYAKINNIQSFLYKMPVLSGDSTGQNISKLILDYLNEENTPLENCLSLSVHNAPVMVGKNNGTLAFLRKEMKHLVCVECPCHLINLAAQKEATCFPINIDDYLISIIIFKEAIRGKKNFKTCMMMK